MRQIYITFIVSTLGMVTHGVLVMKNRKPIKAEELLTIAMWSGAVVTGIYMVASAFKLFRRPGEETNGLYLGIFGVYLFLLSIQKTGEILGRLLPKPVSTANTPNVEPLPRKDGN